MKDLDRHLIEVDQAPGVIARGARADGSE